MEKHKSLRDSRIFTFYVRYQKIIIACLLVLFLFSVGEIVLGNFFKVAQLLNTFKFASYIALFGLCQMIVISAGGSGLDLSVGYAATITSILTASVMDGYNENLWLAILIAIAIGFVIGLLNGVLVSYARLPALVVTMAMANIIKGVVDVYTAGSDITGKPSPVLETIASGKTGNFPNIVFLLIVVAIIVMIVLYKTKIGIKLFGVGANETTAYLSGTNVKRVRCSAFIMSSIIASLMGLIVLGDLGLAFKDMASKYVMPSIVAVVVGGVSLGGGEGNFIGVIAGAVFLQSLTNLLIGLQLGDAAKWLAYGLVLFVLLIAYVRNKRSR